MVCLAPRAPGDSVRPRRLAALLVRPLNFTVRRPTSPTLQRSREISQIRRFNAGGAVPNACYCRCRVLRGISPY